MKIFKPLVAVALVAAMFQIFIPWRENSPERSIQKAEKQKIKALQESEAEIIRQRNFPRDAVITAYSHQWSEWVSLTSPRGETERFRTRTSSDVGYEIQYRSLSGMNLEPETREPGGKYWPPDDVGAFRFKPLKNHLQMEVMFPNR